MSTTKADKAFSAIVEMGLSIEELEDLVDDILAYQDKRLYEEPDAGESDPYDDIQRENCAKFMV